MTNDTTLTQYDHLLNDDADVAAIVIRERLRPVQGARGVFFPPTFAATGRGKSDYQIDWFSPRDEDRKAPELAAREGVIANRCTVDSVPSQANRLEARLLKYSGTLIREVTITGSRVGQGSLDLLEVGHRVGDAVVRYSKVKVTNNGKEEEKDGFELFEKALQAYVKGDAALLAKLAPTSLVFGHWDSRDSATKKSTKSKARRLIRSEIVAFNVQKVTKRSQYWSSIDPEVSQELEQILKEAKEEAKEDPNSKNPASQLGMTDVPAPESPGGVIAFGPIERTTIIALSGLRALATFKATADPGVTGSTDDGAPVIDAERTQKLRRYLFALTLAAAADPGVWDLREGCILVRESKTEHGKALADPTAFSAVTVKHSGAEDTFTLPQNKTAKTYLDAAARAFFGEEEEGNGTKSCKIPSKVELVFDPSGGKAAVSTKSRKTTGDPKTKPELVKALTKLPPYAGKEAEPDRKKIADLKKPWEEAAPKTPDTPAAGEATTDAEKSATGDDDGGN